MKEQGKLAIGILGAFAIAFITSSCYYLIGMYKFNKEQKQLELAIFGKNIESNKGDEKSKKERFPLDVVENIEGDKYIPVDINEELAKLGLTKYMSNKTDSNVRTEELKDDNGNVIGKKEYRDAGHVVITKIENGKVISTTLGTEKDGKLEGEVTVNYPNGDRDTYTYENGVREGQAILYFVNGDKQACMYENDKLNGRAVYYFANGDREEYTYVDEVPEGPARYIYANGTQEEYRYENGERK